MDFTLSSNPFSVREVDEFRNDMNMNSGKVSTLAQQQESQANNQAIMSALGLGQTKNKIKKSKGKQSLKKSSCKKKKLLRQKRDENCPSSAKKQFLHVPRQTVPSHFGAGFDQMEASDSLRNPAKESLFSSPSWWQSNGQEHRHSLNSNNETNVGTPESDAHMEIKKRTGDSSITEITTNSASSTQRSFLTASGQHTKLSAGSPEGELLSKAAIDSVDLFSQVNDHCSSLRLPQRDGFQGDRFIPIRLSCANEKKYELQYEHEEAMLQFHTQQKKKTNKLLSSPNSSQDMEDEASSKGSPHDQRKKELFRNALAAQCLGEDIFTLQGGTENLSKPLPDNGLPSSKVAHDKPMAEIGEQDNFLTGFLCPSRSAVDDRRAHESPNALRLQSQQSILKFKGSVEFKGLQAEEPELSIRQKNSKSIFQQTLVNHGGYFDWEDLEDIAAAPDSSCGGDQVGRLRKINKMPYKVLDAPQLQDDFYLNLVDWSSQNVLAVGLNRAVYIWSACTSQVKKLYEVEDDEQITSVNWSNGSGHHLAIGTNQGDTLIWDTVHCRLVRTLQGHLDRVSAVAWNGSIVSSGSRDRMILSRDLRKRNSITHRHIGHKQEVCGLKWSFDGTQLASGGNDNKLMIWDMHNQGPVAKFGEHQAAVKAIAWNPNQRGVLATGGGTADRCIRFWNTQTLSATNYVDTGSQVCNLVFSKTSNELVSTHGYSLNQICLWKYPTMDKVATLTGHNQRVLYLSMSPCGQNIVTGAGDETLRFWNVFPSMKRQNGGLQLGGQTEEFKRKMTIR